MINRKRFRGSFLIFNRSSNINSKFNTFLKKTGIRETKQTKKHCHFGRRMRATSTSRSIRAAVIPRKKLQQMDKIKQRDKSTKQRKEGEHQQCQQGQGNEKITIRGNKLQNSLSSFQLSRDIETNKVSMRKKEKINNKNHYHKQQRRNWTNKIDSSTSNSCLLSYISTYMIKQSQVSDTYLRLCLSEVVVPSSDHRVFVDQRLLCATGTQYRRTMDLQCAHAHIVNANTIPRTFHDSCSQRIDSQFNTLANQHA